MLTRVRELKALAVFSRSMATCLNAGLPLPRSFSTSVSRLPASKTSAMLRRAARDADPQNPLSENLKGCLPNYLLAMILAGESSGRLVECLEQLSRVCSKLIPPMEAAKKLWLYPLTIIVFGWVLRAGILIHAGANEQALKFLVEIATSVLIVLLIVAASRKFLFVREWIDTLLVRAPIFGDLVLTISCIFFFQAFGLLYRSGGMHVTRMLAIAGDAIPNSAVRLDISRIQAGIENHDTLPEALSRPRSLPVEFRDLLVTGAVCGRLEESIDSACRLSSDRLDQTVGIALPIISKMTAYTVIGSVVTTLGLVLR